MVIDLSIALQSKKKKPVVKLIKEKRECGANPIKENVEKKCQESLIDFLNKDNDMEISDEDDAKVHHEFSANTATSNCSSRERAVKQTSDLTNESRLKRFEKIIKKGQLRQLIRKTSVEPIEAPSSEVLVFESEAFKKKKADALALLNEIDEG